MINRKQRKRKEKKGERNMLTKASFQNPNVVFTLQQVKINGEQ